jgi:Ca2+-binding EF-hand superfamily protein
MSREWFEDPVVLKIKRYALKRGSNGIRELLNSLRAVHPESEDVKLTPTEFQTAIRGRGMALTDLELRHLVHAFDRDRDGRVSLQSFADGLTAMLPPRRRAVITRVWEALGPDEQGYVPLDRVVRGFDASRHPRVRRGEIPREEVEGNFLPFFDGSWNPDGRVHREDFFAYYAGASSNIAEDEYFEDALCSVWGLEDFEDPPNASHGSLLATYSRGNTHAVQQDRSITTHHRPAVASRTLQNCYTKFPNDRNYDMSSTQTKRGMCQTLLDTQPRRCLPVNYETTYSGSFAAPNAAGRTLSQPAPRALRTDPGVHPLATTRRLPATGNQIVDRVRDKIFERGGRGGFRALSRVLRIFGTTQRIDKYELQNGLQTYGIELSANEMEELMRFMDTNGDGRVSVGEFMTALTGPMDSERESLVLQAYSLLDEHGDQSVTFADMRRLYDVQHHPAVLAKEQTPQQVLHEFVAGWDKSDDSCITFDEFADFYTDISAGIDNDQYFALMMRNVWHLSGGEGTAANTSCRRVLVTHTSGRQSVQVIQNDLRIGPDDIDAMRANLAQQGITDVKKIAVKF